MRGNFPGGGAFRKSNQEITRVKWMEQISREQTRILNLFILYINRLWSYKYKHASIISNQNTRKTLLYRNYLRAYKKNEHAIMTFNSKCKTLLETPTTLRGGVNECGALFPKTSLLHKNSSISIQHLFITHCFHL